MANCTSPPVYGNRLSPELDAYIVSVPLVVYALLVAVKLLLCKKRSGHGNPTSHLNELLGVAEIYVGGYARDDATVGGGEPSTDEEGFQMDIPPPPKRLTTLVELSSLLILLSFAYSIVLVLFNKTYQHIAWLLLTQIFMLVAWGANLVLLWRRRNRWDATWIVAGFWVLAFLTSSLSLYDYLQYSTSPMPEYECDMESIMNPLMVVPFVIRYALIVVLSSLVGYRFWRVSTYITNRQYEYTYLNDRTVNGSTDTLDIEANGISSAGLGGMGTTATGPPMSTITEITEAEMTYQPPSSFKDYYIKFKKLIPFIWPSYDRYLQLLIILCVILLILGRLVNILLPYQFRALVNTLSDPDPSTGKILFPWQSILVFVFLRFLQGSGGLINNAQDTVWIPVGQYTTREISIKMFEHLHNLSHRFHLTRKTGEILRVQDRGVSSIVSLLSTILFNIVPTLVDILLAVVVITAQFGIYFGIIVFVTMFFYLLATIWVTEIRTKYRRQTNLLENAMQAKAVDSLLNFETVKFYNAEDFEVRQFAKAMSEYQKADWKSSVTNSLLRLQQNVIIQLGLLVGCLLSAKRVSDGLMTVGDFVMYLSYITQLYGPLNWFGSYYRVLQKNFVDMEKMLDLFRQLPEIRDLPKAAPLKVKDGTVVFENVAFSYDARLSTLKNISFSVSKGQTVALVGPSGGGKSTILRLLFRFYDVQGGRILIDGQDIRTVKQKDLRSIIGVVPQDTVLFNETIRYNMRYGKVTATDAQVEAAARAGQIHNKIMGFPDGYDTKVGERGMRLSGGEKQRVAVARTLLKNPRIVLLDEATSALDTTTERLLQSEFRKMTHNRTTLIIAHRLSTIVHADQILVIMGGYVVERGSHRELMSNDKSVYFDMWTKQLKDDETLRSIARMPKSASRDREKDKKKQLKYKKHRSEFNSRENSDGETYQPVDTTGNNNYKNGTYTPQSKSKRPVSTGSAVDISNLFKPFNDAALSTTDALTAMRESPTNSGSINASKRYMNSIGDSPNYNHTQSSDTIFPERVPSESLMSTSTAVKFGPTGLTDVLLLDMENATETDMTDTDVDRHKKRPIQSATDRDERANEGDVDRSSVKSSSSSSSSNNNNNNSAKVKGKTNRSQSLNSITVPPVTEMNISPNATSLLASSSPLNSGKSTNNLKENNTTTSIPVMSPTAQATIRKLKIGESKDDLKVTDACDAMGDEDSPSVDDDTPEATADHLDADDDDDQALSMRKVLGRGRQKKSRTTSRA